MMKPRQTEHNIPELTMPIRTSRLCSHCRGLLLLAGCAVFTDGAVGRAADDTPPPPAMQVVETAGGTRFGLFGEKPAEPAPTLFVLAASLEFMDTNRLYSKTGQRLSADGWLYVTLDIPCHGLDRKPDEPGALAGWAHRVAQGEDFAAPFVKRCREVLDHLIAEKYTDPDRVAACGTSRGGFCALRFAAAEPRVRAVTCISPVTNLRALSEFAGVTDKQAAPHSVLPFAEKLAGRSIWLSIGNDDARVGTDDCIAFARRLVAETRRQKPDLRVVPVEIVVGPSEGHRAIDDAYELAAQFMRKHVPPTTPRTGR